MIESPETIVFEPLAADEPDAAINKPVTDPDLVQQQFITSSFRTTIRHLQSKGGFRARFRGLSMALVYGFVLNLISRILNLFVPFFLAPIIASVICAHLYLGWTHIVISDPNPKPWYRRIPSIKMWKKVAGPTAILAVAQQAAIALPMHLAATFNFIGKPDDFVNTTNGQRWIMVLEIFLVLALSLALALLVVIPAAVVLIRVQASLLPDELESIVPFDRSFGGKVNPEIVGGNGVIGMLDAWKTFDWNSRVRLVKAYAKVLSMQFALSVLFCLTLGVEIVLIVGKDLKKVFPPKDGENIIFGMSSN